MEFGFVTQVYEVEGHDCSLDIRCVEDEVMLGIFGSMFLSWPQRALRAFRRTWLASKRHPFTQYVFKSTTALCREILRHSEVSLTTIHPFSVFRAAINTTQKVMIVWRRNILLAVANVIGINMEVTPTLLSEVLTVICVSILGLFIIIYVAVQVVLVTRIINFSTTRYEEMQRQLKEYIKFKQIPPALEKRMIEYSKFCFLKTCLREPLIFEFLSSRLKQEVLLHNCNRLIDQMPFFIGMPPPVIAKIVGLLTPEVVLANDVIVRVGMPGDSMYFISSGCVCVISITGREICHLSDGAHFGEIALVEEVAADLRYASVVAIEPTELYRLTRANFQRVVAPHPELMERVVNTARKREGIIRKLEDADILDDMEAAAQYARAGASGARAGSHGFTFYQQFPPPAATDSTDVKRVGSRSASLQRLSLPTAPKRTKRFVPKVPPSLSILAPEEHHPSSRPGEVYRSSAGPSLMEQRVLSGDHVLTLREMSHEDLGAASASSTSFSHSSGIGVVSSARTLGPRSPPRTRSRSPKRSPTPPRPHTQ